jgi:hypothetical protein
MIRFWKIWTVLVLMILATALGYYWGAVDFMINNDFTYLSFVNIAILYGFTVNIMYKAFTKNMETTDSEWFLSDAVLSIGMVGTLSGFLVVLYSTFQGLDPSNTDSMRTAIETLASGMGTALLTSLVGLIASLIMKYQLVTLES